MLSSTLYVQQAWNSQQESELILGKLSWRTWLIANTFAHSQTQPQAFIFFPPFHADLRIIVARGGKGGGKSWCKSVFLPHSFLDNKERNHLRQKRSTLRVGKQGCHAPLGSSIYEVLQFFSFLPPLFRAVNVINGCSLFSFTFLWPHVVKKPPFDDDNETASDKYGGGGKWKQVD